MEKLTWGLTYFDQYALYHNLIKEQSKSNKVQRYIYFYDKYMIIQSLILFTISWWGYSPFPFLLCVYLLLLKTMLLITYFQIVPQLR